MLDQSKAYDAAITGDARRILVRAVVDIVDPDIVYGSVESQSAVPFSQAMQIYDKVFALFPDYSTLECNRWLLDGTFQGVPDGNRPDGQVGYVSGELSGEDGSFAVPQYVELAFSNISILQACSVHFPTAGYDGVPADFTVEVKQGSTVYHAKTVTGNTESSVSLDGFTVYDPDAIRVTVNKWSLPFRRMRVPEIVPGIYEVWDNDIIANFSVTQQANFACLVLPYGTCNLSMDNLSRRFEPRNKTGVFQSIQERQGVEVSIGVKMPDGADVYQPLGVFYQYSGGWKTGDNGLTMQWDLVDILGLLAEQQYLPPATLPTTLGGWVASLVAQLGVNFADRWYVDPEYADLSLTCDTANVTGKTCGDILRWACMATATWPRADAETGYLTAEPYWNQGSQMTLDNLSGYPVIQANADLAAIIFTLADDNGTQYVVSGNATASGNTVQINNPFIHTQAEALRAAKHILSTYGGNQVATTGRGNPASEIGDVDTVWINESSATTGRRMMQTFSFRDGVMQDCQSTLLQADGSFLFEERDVITQSGTWIAPAGVTRLRVILVGGGSGGANGTDGLWDEAGKDGMAGQGGKVWTGTISINDQQAFTVSIGPGGEAQQAGGDTVFGIYSSASGSVFNLGYTDVASGDSYARTGVQVPLAGSGDGGAGGIGGVKGNYHTEKNQGKGGQQQNIVVIDNYPTDGTPGVAGAPGCVVVYWDKVDT